MPGGDGDVPLMPPGAHKRRSMVLVIIGIVAACIALTIVSSELRSKRRQGI